MMRPEDCFECPLYQVAGGCQCPAVKFLRGRIRDLEEQLARYERGGTVSEWAALLNRLKALEDMIEEYSDGVYETLGEMVAAERRVKWLEAELAKTEAQVKVLEAEQREAEGRIKELEEENVALKRRWLDLQSGNIHLVVQALRDGDG